MPRPRVATLCGDFRNTTPSFGDILSENGYDAFAVAYDADNEVNAWNTWYERPAILSLAGDVTGLRVQDVASANPWANPSAHHCFDVSYVVRFQERSRTWMSFVLAPVLSNRRPLLDAKISDGLLRGNRPTRLLGDSDRTGDCSGRLAHG